MGNYAPNYFPAYRRSYTASAAITGGQLVQVSGAGTVAPTSAATSAFLGVAEFDAASGGPVTVLQGCGEHLLIASGTITAGDNVVAAAAGAVADIGAGTNYGQIVGIALTSVTNGQTVPVLFR
jgi:hypothetical protein